MLSFETVTKRFGGVTAVRDASFVVPAGRITGLIGPNGAGKSTAFNLAAGLDYPTSGRILLDGIDISRMPSHQRFHLGLSRSFQLAHEFQSLSVIENFMAAAETQAGERLWCALAQRQRMRTHERRVFDRAMDVVAFLELDAVAQLRAGQLSGGQKKLVELGRILMRDPKIILLDEIGAGVNRTLLGKIANKIRQLNAEKGYTFCLVEHDLDFIDSLCDDVIVMVAGQVLTTGTVAAIRRDERVVEAYFGGGKYQ